VAWVASPDYIEARGMPAHPSELQHRHCMVGFHSSATGGVLPLEFTIDGKLSQITLPSIMAVTGADSYYAATMPPAALAWA
jgi:hypothetical protein